MAPELLAHLYDLALRALAEQERRVSALHGRLAPVLAAAGVGTTVLVRPAVHSGGSTGGLAMGLLVLAAASIGIAVLATAYLLLGDRLTFGVDAAQARTFARDARTMDLAAYHSVMVLALDERRRRNEGAITRLERAFTLIVCGLLVGGCGLVLAAAVAS